MMNYVRVILIMDDDQQSKHVAISMASFRIILLRNTRFFGGVEAFTAPHRGHPCCSKACR